MTLRRIGIGIMLVASSVSMPLPGQRLPANASREAESPQLLTNDVYDSIDVNAVRMCFSNNGITCHDRYTDGAGFEFPKGSGKTLVFQDGLVFGGTVKGEIRVGGSTYPSGWQAGNIDSSSVDPSAARHRIYKIRRIGRAAFNVLPAAEQQRLRSDFLAWPVAAGMRYIDANHNAKYDPDFDAWLDDSAASDKPVFLGDEFFCFFSNDLDPIRVINLYGSSPVGLENCTMLWAYNRPGALENTVFIKHVLVNKGKDAFSNVYFARWLDTDIGDALNDFVGVDSARNMALAYNGKAHDEMYGVAPALGVRMLQGPVRAQPGTRAVYGFGLRQDRENLPVNSFAFFLNGDGLYRDPDLGVAKGAVQMYNYMRSMMYNGAPMTDPLTGLPVRFCLAGDPVAQSGWVDGLTTPAGDRRMMMSAGPITMAPGDTQEVAYAYIVSQGSTVAAGLDALRDISDAVQDFYNHPEAVENLPDLACTATYPVTDSAFVSVRGTLREATSASAVLRHKDGSIVARFPLFDDGAHNDGAANDDVHAGAVMLPRSANGVDCVVDALYAGGDTIRWHATRCVPLAGRPRASLHAVESDHLNFDGIANPGENIRMSIDVRNSTPFALGPWRVRNAGFGDALLDALVLDSVLTPSASAWHAYDGVDARSFLSFDVPSSAGDGEQFALPVAVEEEHNNCWCDTLLVTAHRFALPVADSATVHTAGPCTDSFGWRVALADSLRDHAYRITVRGSEFDSKHTVTIADLTIPKVLLADAPLPSALAHESPVLDGWKLTRRGIVENWIDSTNDTWQLPDTMLAVRYLPEAHRWYLENVPFQLGSTFLGSQLGAMDAVPVKLIFDRQHTQKAYQYLRGGTPNYGYTGYFDIPIRAYDMSDPSMPRQLGLAFVEQKGAAQQNNTWDPVTALDREYLFILKSDYSAQPDPALQTYKINADAIRMPILYASWWYGQTASSTFIDGDSLLVRPVIPVTERDTFFVHPAAPRVGVARPAAPQLLAPHDTASSVAAPAALSWTPPSGAEFHSVQVASDVLFTRTAAMLRGIKGASVTVPGLATGAKYYWRVSAMNSAGDGPWSATWSFTMGDRGYLGSPIQLLPAAGAVSVDTLPTFAWRKNADAIGYQLQVSNAQFSTPYDIDVTVTDTSYRATRRLRDRVSYWRVRAIESAGPGLWSAVHSFSSVAAVPALRAPIYGATDVPLDTVLSWQAALGAASYRVQLADSSDFGFTSPFDNSGITGLSLPVGPMQKAMRYRWRVASVNFAGQSDWSTPWIFTTSATGAPPPPEVRLPANGAVSVDTLPTFVWAPVENATAYQLQVSDALFHVPYDLDVTVADTMYRATRRLRDHITYWRVRALFGAGSSAWSQRRSFTSTAAIPVLRSPATGSIGVGAEVRLEWNAAEGAGAYRVQLSDKRTFPAPRDTTGIFGTAVTFGGLKAQQEYWWRVASINVAGESEWSEVWYFTRWTPNDVAAGSPASPGFRMHIAPQPATDAVQVYLEELQGAGILVTLTDALGRRIAEQHGSGADRLLLRFPVSNLPPGMYLLRAVGARSASVQRVLVTH